MFRFVYAVALLNTTFVAAVGISVLLAEPPGMFISNFTPWPASLEPESVLTKSAVATWAIVWLAWGTVLRRLPFSSRSWLLVAGGAAVGLLVAALFFTHGRRVYLVNVATGASCGLMLFELASQRARIDERSRADS